MAYPYAFVRCYMYILSIYYMFNTENTYITSLKIVLKNINTNQNIIFRNVHTFKELTFSVIGVIK